MKRCVILIIFWLFSIVLIYNSVLANFSGPTPFGIGVCDSSIVLGDIDGDGDLDLIVTGSDTGYRLDKYINDSTGNFSDPTNIGIGVWHSSIALGDIDGDGDLDLIVTGSGLGSSGERLDKYINDGEGNFSVTTNIGTGVYYSSIVLGDIDGDGDLDLIVSGEDVSFNRWLDKYINDGEGNFSGPTNIGIGVSRSSIALGDINGDGDLDLIVSGRDSSTAVRLDKYTNDGAGNFSGPITNWGTEVFWGSIALGDIDGDGDLDLIASGEDDSFNRWLNKYTNDGYGNFSGESFGTKVDESSIALGDIDGDGDLDLIVSGLGSSGERLDKYINTNSIINKLPDAPTALNTIDSNGYWRFVWSPASDDHTPTSLMQYKIAIGTNSSGVYDYISTNIDYPRGQANIGNIPQGWINNTQCVYQSKIPVTKTVYWKVAAIDTSFKFSWSSEASSSSSNNEGNSNNGDESSNNDGEKLSIDNIILAPNLFNPYKSEKDYLTFLNCPDDTKIRIYNIVGKKERELKNPDREHKIIWDATDSSGKPLPSGVYTAVAEDSKGNTKYIKFVIQR